jgi:hypothetical protein
VILLHSMLEYPLWYGPFQMAFGLCVWLLWRAPDLPAGADEVARAVRRAGAPTPATVGSAARFTPTLSALTAIVLIAIATYAAWEYHRISQIYLIPKMRSEAYRVNTLQQLGDSWLFQNQVRFAELTTTPLTIGNAAHIRDLSLALLHFSPEPRVVEKLIESDVMLGLADEARFYLVRYQAAFPESHARWAQKNAQGKM